jgi:hypothetical protein
MMIKIFIAMLFLQNVVQSRPYDPVHPNFLIGRTPDDTCVLVNANKFKTVIANMVRGAASHVTYPDYLTPRNFFNRLENTGIAVYADIDDCQFDKNNWHELAFSELSQIAVTNVSSPYVGQILDVAKQYKYRINEAYIVVPQIQDSEPSDINNGVTHIKKYSWILIFCLAYLVAQISHD